MNNYLIFNKNLFATCIMIQVLGGSSSVIGYLTLNFLMFVLGVILVGIGSVIWFLFKKEEEIKI